MKDRSYDFVIAGGVFLPLQSLEAENVGACVDARSLPFVVDKASRAGRKAVPNAVACSKLLYLRVCLQMIDGCFVASSIVVVVVVVAAAAAVAVACFLTFN
eukprot:1058725-Amphidinium_carterae.1